MNPTVATTIVITVTTTTSRGRSLIASVPVMSRLSVQDKEMNASGAHMKPILVLLIVGFLTLLNAGCSRETSEEMFVGKWKSSKLETPLYLYDNGEWEIKTESGTVLQYGVWDYEAGEITWSYKWGSLVKDDVNPVLSATGTEFQVKESDGTTTTFIKLDQQE